MFSESGSELFPTNTTSGRGDTHAVRPVRRPHNGNGNLRSAIPEQELTSSALVLHGALSALSHGQTGQTASKLLVQTFGGLKLSRAGRTVSVRGKGRALLVELLARGGDDVAAAEVANALWPHGELDYAMGALNTTLYRLRKVPGLEQALTLHDGRIGLDRDHCLVDQWLVDGAVTAATVLFECQAASFDLAAARELLGVLVTSYRGPLLEQDSSATVIERRALLRARVAHILAYADALDVPVGPVGRSWQVRLDLVHPKAADARRAH